MGALPTEEVTLINQLFGVLKELQKHAPKIFAYGERISKDFPSKTYLLCLDEIRRQSAKADNRMKYKSVCGNIKKLFSHGTSETHSVIHELKTKHPRRPAMIDELERLTVRLAKKGAY